MYYRKLQQEFRDSSDLAEEFEINSTKIWNINILDPFVISFLKRVLKDSKTKVIYTTNFITIDTNKKESLRLS